MNNQDKARLIVDRLGEKVTELGGVSWSIVVHVVAQTLDEIDATDDPFMPTNEEWAEYPWARFAATDDDGAVFLYEKKPELGAVVWWRADVDSEDSDSAFELIRYLPVPADFRSTLRQRPKGI